MTVNNDDWEMIRRMCEIQCTMGEILHIIKDKFSGDTIEREIKARTGVTFKEYRKQHAAYGKAKLRRLQWEAAESGNITMLIWLGKNILGQADKSKIQHADDSKNPKGVTGDDRSRARAFLGYAPKKTER